MTFREDEESSMDLFNLKLIEWNENRLNDEYGIFEVDEAVLKSLSDREVYFI